MLCKITRFFLFLFFLYGFFYNFFAGRFLLVFFPFLCTLYRFIVKC